MNYLDHLKNRGHASEKNTFQWLSGSDDDNHPHLSIDSSMSVEDIKNLVGEFIRL